MTKLDLLIYEIDNCNIHYICKNRGFSFLFVAKLGIRFGYGSFDEKLFLYGSNNTTFELMSKPEQNGFIEYVEQKFNIKIERTNVG